MQIFDYCRIDFIIKFIIFISIFKDFKIFFGFIPIHFTFDTSVFKVVLKYLVYIINSYFIIIFII